MRHQTREQLSAVAQVEQGLQQMTLSRNDRLERWAGLLEQKPQRLLSTLFEIEYQPARLRDKMRSDNSPISVASEDPVLRSAGLKNDTFGEARRFFEVSAGQLHEVICYCHFGTTISAATAARTVRSLQL
ncbi:hypothetical protein LJR257_006839 [Ensifer adhaerens]